MQDPALYAESDGNAADADRAVRARRRRLGAGARARAPAVITAAPSRAEARQMLEDAVREYLLAMLDQETADEAPAKCEREQLPLTIGD